ncbi:MAG: esterase family protein [Deltaproteobacteria bacterium]|nr:esterase family protein [Deltaproteobacteria bacterium]
MMKRALLLFLLVSTEALAAPAPGKVVYEKFKSDALGVEKDVVVYLPAGYDPKAGKRWPVFYYLHGLGGDETNWTKHGNLEAAANELGLGAIVVMPDGDNGFYANSVTPTDYDRCMKDGTGLFDPKAVKAKTCVRKPAYETYIVKDLVGWVDRTYRTIPDRTGRGIAGLSMGGFGALELGIRHQDLFSAVVSHSGVTALMYKGPVPYQKGKVELLDDPTQWGVAVGPIGDWVRAIFGTDRANWTAHDPAQLLDKIKPGLALYLDCGTEDEFLLHNGAAYVHDLLLARNIKHDYYAGPGHHNFTFWAARLPKSLAFLAKNVAPAK